VFYRVIDLLSIAILFEQYVETCFDVRISGETIRYDVIALDANTGDPSKPLMCPAEEFLESEILQAFSRVLNDQGLLSTV